MEREITQEDLIIPTDADILRIVLELPELLNNNYVKRRYNNIINILNSLDRESNNTN